MAIQSTKEQNKRMEEARQRALREKAAFIQNLFTIVIATTIAATVVFVAFKYFSTKSWNLDVVKNTKSAWTTLDGIERDLLAASLFNHGCPLEMFVKKTATGFDLLTTQAPTDSMSILRDVPLISEDVVALKLGTGIRVGDELFYCSSEESYQVKIKSIGKAQQGFDYILFDPIIRLPEEGPANVKKLTFVSYEFRNKGGKTDLFRIEGTKEVEILADLASYSINLDLASQNPTFVIELVLTRKFPDGKPIQIKRVVPLNLDGGRSS